jgi:hypothetical protein
LLKYLGILAYAPILSDLGILGIQKHQKTAQKTHIDCPRI